ncbi:COP1-interacting protein 7 [Cornus florida]|uniref:COP1-interacting protein 7 n=1 Tax=Cornus florida TaxID=4283 RepID=UPI00289B8B36|nr:COP1-interacting protein 7 [Cornus florida]
MKSSTRLDSAIFQLTPTRTRCDLIITANAKTEKIASGLVSPFLAHLKTAQDQIAKGGYSILLEPEPGTDATWFTKGTVERFVRFVSTPEILERVYTIESEILQIEEAIAIQGNNDIGLNSVEIRQVKPVGSSEDYKPTPDEEKAIVLYKPGTHPPEANGSITQEGNSKVQLLKVLETRKIVLQKEQGMDFARAVAAGFDIDHMALLVSFAECFGASRLMDACLRFVDLWKGKHESGEWVEIEAAEAMSSRSDFSTMNASGIMLSSVASKHNESSNGLASENNVKAGVNTSADERPMDHQAPVGQREYYQGQFPHPVFPSWPIHSPNGSMPVFQPYPMQGMPYYQNYPGNGPFYQPPYPPVEDYRSPAAGPRQKRQSLDSRDSNTESETWEMDASKTSLHDDLASEKEVSQSREPRKKAGRSVKKQSGMVVIRNINYITSKRQNSSGSESEPASDCESDNEAGELQTDTSEMMHKNSLRSSKRKGRHEKSVDELNSYDKEKNVCGKETDTGHWQAFQNCLLRDADENNRAANQSMFVNEKDVQMKRRQYTVGDDPLALGRQDAVEIQEGMITEFHKASGNVTRTLRLSNDEVLISRGEGHYDDGRGSTDDVQVSEINGRKGVYNRGANDEFMINGRGNQSNFVNSTDPLAVNGFERATNNFNRSLSSDMADESFIVPFRSMSLDHVGTDNRTAIDMDSELPSTVQKSENNAFMVGSQFNYEPDGLSFMPERRTEKMSIGFDPALDYKMQVGVEDAALVDNRNKEVVTAVKRGSKKSEKDQKSKVTPDSVEKKKTGGPIRKGKPSKTSPLDDARARAERLRSFKAELQKMKKEKEEEEMKRIEALKKERQKRIAARGSSTSTQSPLPSMQTRKQVPTKLSPSSHKGSKFSDSEPGLSSPLQRSNIRTASLGSGDTQKASKARKSSDGSHLPGNRLSKSVSSLSEPKKESSGVTPDSKASVARIRRLSEPKTISSHQSTSVKTRSAEPVSKPKVSNGPESKKISAIINLDRSKAATLPELKIRTSKGPSDVGPNKSVKKEMTQRVNDSNSSVTSETAELNRDNGKIDHQSDVDDNPVVEKTVVVLECEKPSISIVHASVEKMGIQKGHYDNRDVGAKVEVVSEYACIRAPTSSMDETNGESIQSRLQEQPPSYEVGSVMTGNAEKESPKFSSINTAEKPYHAPYARVSSLEEPCNVNSEYGKAPPTSLDMVTTGVETAKAQVSDFKNLKLEKIPEASEKPLVKESSKGFRRLLKFGKKNHSSAAGDRSVELDNASLNGSEADDNATKAAASSEVFTLKNLISQDETPSAGTTSQKSSRHFSLLSPFRSKTSEKKLAT